MDFKALKRLVLEAVISKLDRKLILSKSFLATNNVMPSEVMLIFQSESTAENLLVFIRKAIDKSLPGDAKLISLKLCETSDSYAEGSAG